MKASELSTALADASLPNDPLTQGIVCTAFEAFRDYLALQVVSQRGILGFIRRVGLRLAVDLLDDYLADNCGAAT